MALTLKEIQAKLIAQEAAKDKFKSGGAGGDNSVYPFWANPDNTTATMRFVVDGDTSNDFFWRERLLIKLPFRGIKGQDENKMCTVQVPSTDMWTPNSDPIAAEIRPWWKDKSLEDMARKYWRKKSYVFQGFVPLNPNKEEAEPTNPIRRFVISQSVFDIIKSILMDQDLENNPTDVENGRDFYLTKTTKGGFANYASSKWAMKERPLNAPEREAIETYGLPNIGSSTSFPKKPDAAHISAMMEMFAASVDGDLYDPERWGQFYAPYGMRQDNANANNSDNDHSNTTSSSVVASASSVVSAASVLARIAPKVSATSVESEAVDPPFDVDVQAPVKKTQDPNDIIAALRKRQASK